MSEFDPHFQQVVDLGNFPAKEVVPPAFTRFMPPGTYGRRADLG